MMDCRRAQQLLPLWIGQDLPDVASATDVANHLKQCPTCEQQRSGLQSSLEALQGSAETLSVERPSRSLWPVLVTQISDWEVDRRRDRFNGWIPASVMALAVALMVAVSIPSIHEEFFGEGANVASSEDLFAPGSVLDAESPVRFSQNAQQTNQQAVQTPVRYKEHKVKVRKQDPNEEF